MSKLTSLKHHGPFSSGGGIADDRSLAYLPLYDASTGDSATIQDRAEPALYSVPSSSAPASALPTSRSPQATTHVTHTAHVGISCQFTLLLNRSQDGDQVVHALGKHFAPQAQAQGDSGNLKGNGPAYERPDA